VPTRLVHLAVDAAQPDRLARFWAAAFGWQVAAAIGARFGTNKASAWRFSERRLTPLRPQIRQVARALLVYPRHLPYQVAAAIARYQGGKPVSESSTTSAPAWRRSLAVNEPVATPTARTPACTAAAISGGLSPT
jgi:Glyoxalase-like domain